MFKPLLFAALISSFSVSAQHSPLSQSSLSLEYNDVSIGRNFNLTYRSAISKNVSLYGGVKYLVNRDNYTDDQHQIFIKRSFAETGGQHWGFKLGLERNIYRTRTSEIFGFYDFQYTRAMLRTNDYFPAGYDSTGRELFTNQAYLFGPVNSFENYIGIGARLEVSKNLFLKGFFGGGAMYLSYEPYDKVNKISMGDGGDFEFIRMFGVGIEYKIK